MIEIIKGTPCLVLSLVEKNGAALTPDKMLGWKSLIDEQALNPEITCLILKGNEEIFCTGFDLMLYVAKKQGVNKVVNYLKDFKSLLDTIQFFPKPVIAQVEGQAMGGGLGLLAVSDIVIGSSKAVFKLPETLMGIIPGVVFPYIAQRIGVSKARYLALGGILDGQMGYQAGLLDELSEDLEKSVKKMIFRIARLDSQAINLIKRLSIRYSPLDPNYFEDVFQNMEFLLNQETTQNRITSFCEGFTPWGSS